MESASQERRRGRPPFWRIIRRADVQCETFAMAMAMFVDTGFVGFVGRAEILNTMLRSDLRKSVDESWNCALLLFGSICSRDSPSLPSSPHLLRLNMLLMCISPVEAISRWLFVVLPSVEAISDEITNSRRLCRRGRADRQISENSDNAGIKLAMHTATASSSFVSSLSPTVSLFVMSNCKDCRPPWVQISRCIRVLPSFAKWF